MAATPAFVGAIGIDLGTTYSCVSVWRNGKVEVIPNEQGHRTTPSYCAFTDTQRLIGEPARNQMGKNASNTVYDAKRLIGRKFDDPTVQQDAKTWPFKVVADEAGMACVEVQYKGEAKVMKPEQISGLVLQRLKDSAEAYLGAPVTKAVITVPAYFNDAQRKSTKNAGKMGGLDVLRIINEPTAAAVAHGLDAKGKGGATRKVLVFDLGGGTFDVSVIQCEESVIDVKATSGNTHLGGQDFDNALVDYCLEEFQKKTGHSIGKNSKAVRRLRTACEAVKRTLSSATTADVEVDCIHEGEDLNVTVSRAKFEQINKTSFEGCLKEVEKVLKDAKLKVDDVDDVVMVGGSSRIPKIQSMLSEYFNNKPLCHTINPDEAVSHGAAIQANILAGDEKSREEVGDLVLIDVTPLSIGVDVDGGVLDVLIPRNSTIPRKVDKEYSTAFDYQQEVSIDIYEGERPRAKMNNFLGTFDLCGLKRAKAGKASIVVTFSIDANGMLEVTAKDAGGTASGKVEITGTNQRSAEAVQQMLEDAEKFLKEDKEAARRLTLRTKGEQYVYELLELAESRALTGLVDTLNGHLEWLEAKGEEATKRQLEDRMDTLAELHDQLVDPEPPTKDDLDADWKDEGPPPDSSSSASEGEGDGKEKKPKKEKKTKKKANPPPGKEGGEEVAKPKKESVPKKKKVAGTGDKEGAKGKEEVAKKRPREEGEGEAEVKGEAAAEPPKKKRAKKAAPEGGEGGEKEGKKRSKPTASAGEGEGEGEEKAAKKRKKKEKDKPAATTPSSPPSEDLAGRSPEA